MDMNQPQSANGGGVGSWLRTIKSKSHTDLSKNYTRPSTMAQPTLSANVATILVNNNNNNNNTTTYIKSIDGNNTMTARMSNGMVNSHVGTAGVAVVGGQGQNGAHVTDDKGKLSSRSATVLPNRGADSISGTQSIRLMPMKLERIMDEEYHTQSNSKPVETQQKFAAQQINRRMTPTNPLRHSHNHINPLSHNFASTSSAVFRNSKKLKDNRGAEVQSNVVNMDQSSPPSHVNNPIYSNLSAERPPSQLQQPSASTISADMETNLTLNNLNSSSGYFNNELNSLNEAQRKNDDIIDHIKRQLDALGRHFDAMPRHDAKSISDIAEKIEHLSKLNNVSCFWGSF